MIGDHRLSTGILNADRTTMCLTEEIIPIQHGVGIQQGDRKIDLSIEANFRLDDQPTMTFITETTYLGRDTQIEESIMT